MGRLPHLEPAKAALTCVACHGTKDHLPGLFGTVIAAPDPVIPGIDWRHPTAVAEELAHTLRNGHLAPVTLEADLQTSEDFAPAVRDFLATAAPV